MAIRLELEITVDDKGAVTAVKRVGEEADKTTGKMKAAGRQGTSALQEVQDRAVKLFLSYQAVTRAASAFYEAMKDGMGATLAEERQVRGLAAQLNNFHIMTAQSVGSIDAFASSMEAMGIQDDQARAGLARMLPITRDLATAMSATSVAVGIARNEQRDFNATLDLVSKLMIGSERALIPAMAEYGVKVDAAASKSKQLEQALQQIWQRGLDGASATKDHLAQWDALKITWSNIFEGAARSAINGLESMGTSLDGLNDQLRATVAGHNALSQMFRDIAAGGILEAVPAFRAMREELQLFNAEALIASANKAMGSGSAGAPKIDWKTKDTAEYTAMVQAARTPVQQYAEQLQQLHEMYERGSIDADQYGKAVAMLGQALPHREVKATADSLRTLSAEFANIWALLDSQPTEDKRPWWAAPPGDIAPIAPTMASGQVPGENDPAALAATRVDAEILFTQSIRDMSVERMMIYAGEEQYRAGLTDSYIQTALQGEMAIRSARLQAVQVGLQGIQSLAMTIGRGSAVAFRIGQAAAIANATVQYFQGLMNVMATAPIYGYGAPAYIATMKTMLAITLAASIAGIAAQKPPTQGQAHSGLNYVPSTGSYLLERGESVIPKYRNVPGYSGGGGTQLTINAYGTWRPDDGELFEIITRADEARDRGRVN